MCSSLNVPPPRSREAGDALLAEGRDRELATSRESRLVLSVGVVNRAIFDGDRGDSVSPERDRSAERSCGLGGFAEMKGSSPTFVWRWGS